MAHACTSSPKRQPLTNRRGIQNELLLCVPEVATLIRPTTGSPAALRNTGIVIVLLSLIDIAAAELVLARDPGLGAWLHAALMLILLWHGALRVGSDQRVSWCLALVPLSRVLSLSFPFAELSYAQQYALASALALLAAVLAAHALGYGPAELGLGWRWRQLPLHLLVGMAGLPLGLVESRYLTALPVVALLDPRTSTLLVVAVVVFAAFVEELMFRGLMQSTLRIRFGSWVGPLGATAAFAALSVSSGSWPTIALAVLAGGLFAVATARTGSVWGVSLAHGLSSAIVLLAPGLGLLAAFR
jgi:membrane protease YdiL (CAAX protease family)